MEETGRHQLNQEVKEISSVMGQIEIVHHLIDAMSKTQHHILRLLHNLYLVMSKHQTSSNRGTATK